MFEAHVLHLLRRYLGEYVHGLSAEALRISVWKGDVVLKDLKLKAEALNSLKLPVTVKAGFVGTITLKVPWKSFGKEPVIVLVDRVFILAHPASDGRTFEEDRESLFEVKLQQIEEAEAATLEAVSRSKLGNPGGSSWLSSLIATIIGNLKISISNVHIRYEDSVSNKGHPFSSGMTLAKLAAVTTDENGNETFDTSGALDKLRKSLQLERLALYHDSDSMPWKIDKKWEDLSSPEWIEIFEDGINGPATDQGEICKWAMDRNYVVSPINGVLKYHRLGNQERIDPEIPFEKASLVLTDVSLTIFEAQYHDWIKLFEAVSRYKTYIEIAHLRPVVPVSQGPHLWWCYAARASLQQKQLCYRFSWDQIKHLCQLRRRYVQLYASFLQQSENVKNSEVREIEKDLDSKVILLWRLLAHAKVETVKSKEAAEQRRNRKKSWFSLGWQRSSGVDVPGDVSASPDLSEGGLTKEEWQAINNFLSYQPDEDLTLHSGKDMQNMIKFLVTISIGQAAARIICVQETEILCGRFEELHVSTKFRLRSTHCDVLLKFYGLSSPEGSLAQSVSSEQKENALAASFVQSPVGEDVDWKLSAAISPCHATVWMESYERFLEFVKRSNAISPRVAMETATALQMKFEKVTRRAQEQFQMVLEEQNRFALDIDFGAPKVRVPIRACASTQCDGHFLLDFGHFTLYTKESHAGDHSHNLYSRFYVSGRDMAAFFTDCGSDCQSGTFVMPTYNAVAPSLLESADNCYSVIDRCGMAVIVDQIKGPHPSYPSTRVSVQVPNLGIHFSPARYQRFMELMNILYGTVESSGQLATGTGQEDAPWSSADLSANARIQVWKGIGKSVASWQPCYVVLSGLYLYVMESEKSVSYQRFLSMAGKQVLEVPPSNVGGSKFCVAVSFRGMNVQTALESSSTWIIELRDEEEKTSWMKGLVQATYQASAPPAVDVLEDLGGILETDEPSAMDIKTADLVVNGALLETKVFIYGKTIENQSETPGKLEETLILEILAGGGKVHVTCWESDLTVKMKLHSLKIKDELQGCMSKCPQYLASSVLKNDRIFTFPNTSRLPSKEFAVSSMEEDDIFDDALPEFMCLSDSISCSQNLDAAHAVKTANNHESIGTGAVETLLPENDFGKGKDTSGEIFYETEGSDNSDFVSVSFSTRSLSSPDYYGVDTQMNIRMSKLEFFCNRPTLVALIALGIDLSAVYSRLSNMEAESANDNSLLHTEKREDNGHDIVKGLLGHGKGRVIFNLNMNVDSVSVFLNKEDDSQLAMFVQESFLLDLKVHPSSLSIEGTLGNFRLCDMSLGIDHHWGWLCDIRKPGVESLIKFTFKSYGVDDDDYEGYDYSLFCRLSAVRIVFLYRFVQEVTAYFMELATPHTEEAIKLVDKVGDFEWLIHKYEIDGSTAVKLDLSLDTPIIIVPRNSMSKDFIQLDLGQLRVTNEFSWHGSLEDNPSAVHIDILHAEILGINMSIGFETFIGKPMIREGHGLDVYVRRSLRDVFRKVPAFALEVKVDLLHVVMSDKEYNVILDCTYMNLNEQPRLPPSFRDDISGSKETIRLLADKVNTNSQMLLSRNVTIMAVEVKYALLELCNGIDEESPLAHIALDGLWVSYRMTSLSETDLYVTIPKFSIVDIRPDTKPEMRLMLGSATDASKQVSGSFPFSLNKSGLVRMTSEVSLGIELPNSTMFLMDYRWRVSSQSFVVRIQQPRVLVVPDFLLAVGEFFVPALGAMTGREEMMDPKNDPITRNSSIILSQPICKQTEEVVHLSPNKQLVIDAVGVDDYTYDGCGKIICLSEGALEKENCLSRSQPIIIIGRGKRLRFMNVKIENGYLLRKYTYLSNDSSYSVSSDDGVDISLLDHFTSDSEKKGQTYIDYSSETCNTSQVNSDKVESLTFEAQVVSPEFTFYDGTKSSLDDSIFGEKLLRAKMDLSFMYASKERDTWIRALVKDLMVESGSGLIVLDPVDLSGGYTSVKDKTSISVVSTDMCIHLSLSVISLVLSLHSQAATALQFSNANPLALCTNFERLWVSSKENGARNNLTFWRPRAPSNYVILGDCVTSRPVPPSQSVIAVSNTYGRVRKPLGFKLIGSFSGIQGLACGEGGTSNDCDCSLWTPVAPPGYKAMGCVAAVGDQPPPNHIVYCLREDLVASASYSECILSVSANAHFSSGFSIWRLDNVLWSFCAHSSSECPPRNISYDISHILLWNSNRHSSAKEYADSSIDDGFHSNQESDEKTSSSGWDMLRSISKASNYYTTTPNFERIWWDKGSVSSQAVSIWRPIAPPDYAIVGDCITEGLEPPALGIIFKAKNADVSAMPVQFTKVAHIMGKGAEDMLFWYPIAPSGYVSVGCIVTRTGEMPLADSICCPRMDLVNQGTILEVPITRSSSSRTSHCWSIWKVENQAHTFLARSDLKKPSSRLAYTIGDYVKPKRQENAQENITVDMKLRCFSLTILDSLYGMMTPMFDTTITNIQIATHGRPEAMDAVLVSSFAASTFNTQLEAWEPLVEPFDGIFKFETYDTGVPQSRLGMRVRVAAKDTLNINASAANLENFAETIISWRRQIELEEKAARLNEELGTHCEQGGDSAFSALDEDDFQTVIIENKLGIDIYLKKLEQSANTVEVLHHDSCVSIWIPPPTFSDRLNVADHQSGEAQHYVSVQILEAKDLPIVDDGNSHNFFCALRLVVENQTTDQQKLFPQSSRTKCVKPIISNTTDAVKGTATWNELFIFKVPGKGKAKLEIEVTNLAAKAGKGEVVGAFSFVVGYGANTLKKVASGRILQQSNDVKNIMSYPLQRRGQSNIDEHTHESACLLVSTTYFEKKRSLNLQRDSGSEDNIDRDIGFWVGLSPEDKWESFRSLLPLSVVPKVLNNEFMAMEVFMENGKKHAIFRGLATVVNYADVNFDISVCHESSIQNQNSIHARHKQFSEDDKSFSKGFLSSLAAGSSAILPWRSTFSDSNQCFQVRPAVDLSRPSYLWGRAVAVSSADSFGKDQFFIDQSLLYQDSSKHGNKVSNLFKLNHLEKKDVLLCCRPSTGSKLFWLSVGADASALHTELNAPVYDWKICINSPLKLENRLPCPAEFTIWEKTKDGTTIEREQAILSSRRSVNIYSADIQKTLYLSLFVQGGWVLEREPVLLLDLSSNNHVSSFWMVHQQSYRRLRISVERDMGGTTAAPKTIRFFVPYWIVNDCSLPLAYQLVELESADNVDTDLFLSRAVKSAKTTFSAVSMDKRRFGSRKNIQMLEIIDDTSPIPSMLSPRDYTSRSGGTLFPSRGDSFVSPRVGIAVAVRGSHNFSPGISLLELEKKEHIDVKAFKPDGSYYKLSALLNMTSDRTKVIYFQPQILFINRVGCSVCLQQCDSQLIEWIHPADPPKPFAWDSSAKFELLKLWVDGYEWSTSFSVSTEGLMCISLKKVTGTEQLNLKVAVRSGTKNSRYDVVICPYSFSSPYRIENRSMFLPLHFRQVDGITDSWQSLLPNSSASFIWEDLGRRRLLEILVGGVDPAKSETFNIDEICDHQAIHMDGKALHVTVLKEDKTNIVRISDWMPENELGAVKSGWSPTTMSPHFINNLQHQNSLSSSTGEFHFIIDLPELGLSIIDHTPEEILYLSIQNLLLSYSSGLGSEISRFNIRLCGIQVDNQLPLSPMPVLFRLQRAGEETEYILKFSMTMQSNGSPDLCVYPYIGLHGPENSAFVINIHEPIIWRLHEMMQQVNLKRLHDAQETAVSVDPIIQIGVLNISEVRLKVSMAMSPTQRPRGVLGFWASLMTALGNTENMPVKINQRFHENVSMRQSTMVSNAISNVQKDLLSQPLLLLSGVDILGNASSALGHMSKGVAALSMDKKFIQSRQRQENKGVEDLGDVIREGGGALAKGLFRGVTGILTKPLEGAKTSGVEGFVQGVGKGIIGAAAQPVSGVLDLLSKTTEGANAVRMKIASAITSEEQLLRKRLPRVIGGDNLLCPYDDYKAQGQVILQLAESGSFLGQVDLFKVRGKFALSDAYEDHFLLPKGKILMVTHRRVILLQQPSNIMNQRKFSPARDPCSVLWDVMWDTLMFMELAYGKKDHPKEPHSRLILYLQTRSTDSKDQIRIIKCIRESHQAVDIYNSIERALNTYGPNKSMGMLIRKVTKPYSPIGDAATSESSSKECGSLWSPQQVPSSVCLSSTFCSSTN